MVKTLSGWRRTSWLCDREQPFLLPPDVRHWLPDDHLAWFVIDAVAVMDLSVSPPVAYRPPVKLGADVARHVFEWSKLDGGHESFLRNFPRFTPSSPDHSLSTGAPTVSGRLNVRCGRDCWAC